MSIRYLYSIAGAMILFVLLLSLDACDKGKTAGKEEEDTIWTWDRCTTEGWDTTDNTWHPCDSLLYLDVRAACEWEQGEKYQKMYQEDVALWRDNVQYWRGLKKLSPRIKEIYFAYYYHFGDGPNLTELPQEIWEIPRMKGILFQNFPKLKKIPDVRLENEVEYMVIDSIIVPFPKGLDKTKITDFEWNHSKLDTLPDELREMASQFYAVKFWECSLDSLPTWIGEFRHSSMEFGGNELRALPESVVNWSSRGIVGLLGNQLDSLPENFCQYGTERLILGGNRLCTMEAWPSCIDSIDVVEEMKYQHCQ